VRSDGTRLRRLAHPGDLVTACGWPFPFSRDGRTVAYDDRGLAIDVPLQRSLSYAIGVLFLLSNLVRRSWASSQLGLTARIASAGALLIGFGGCGDGGEGTTRELTLRAFAYVVTQCGESDAGWTAHQELRIRQKDGSEVVVREIDVPPDDRIAPLCTLYARARIGSGSAVALPLQRLGISRDASTVVFEVTDDFSIFSRTLLPPEGEGIFEVRANGTGLHRIAPASQDAPFRFVTAESSPLGVRGSSVTEFHFSPDGQTIVYTDYGPGRSGESAIQVFAFDLTDGERTQITYLPSFVSDPAQVPVVLGGFINDDTVIFVTAGRIPSESRRYAVKTDGKGHLLGLDIAESPEGALGAFSIAGNGRGITTARIRGQSALELFAFDFRAGHDSIPRVTDFLQLTNFQRDDTGYSGRRITPGGERALFAASTNVAGTNPTENCQIFSMDSLGGHAAQLTRFDPGEASQIGCRGAPIGAPGCRIGFLGLEAESDAILLTTDCDPQGGYLKGENLFAMRSDGTGSLHQITKTRGVTADSTGRLLVEMPGPVGYPEVSR